MDPVYEHDISLPIDMDDLGVRPFDWLELNKNLDDPLDEFFGKEKTIDFTVYSAEFQLNNFEKKITTDGEEETSMSDEDSNNNYEIDPETGKFQYEDLQRS